MSTVQFEPKVAVDFQIDWRRPSMQDPFADLLKRHFEIDQRVHAPKKREEAADPLSGRPARVVIAHERTLRGEAKRVEDSDRCLPRPADHDGQRADVRHRLRTGRSVHALEHGGCHRGLLRPFREHRQAGCQRAGVTN